MRVHNSWIDIRTFSIQFCNFRIITEIFFPYYMIKLYIMNDLRSINEFIYYFDNVKATKYFYYDIMLFYNSNLNTDAIRL